MSAVGTVRRVEQVMGLPVSVDLRDERIGEQPVRRVFDWLHEVDARFSPFRLDSEVSLFSRGELAESELSTDLRYVLQVCVDYQQRTGGAFRAWLPGRALDPCAVVKGWAVQRAAGLLRRAGARNFCLNAGGDVLTQGVPEPGKRWRVGIRHPDQADQLCGVLEVGSAAVATSAAYERGAHIVDGRTGLPPRRALLSMTVLAADLTVADTTATAAFALGEDGIAWAAAEPGCSVFAVRADRTVFSSPGLPLV
ncbi:MULTISPECIES: FAD:protein FMN transferase [unclassified Crossiella]|uniref:FAD:protein FMN transferase n=1 Tax=unclassified Crossiella TaxID=2620835 RepID=UPI001FFFE5C4|nr:MULTISPECIES: FAD:protein FMN transferase [unclassified Crossiella]MCK2241152.1 FAD:protein FMN transferase [Crossiella sp. S99.2]MCK2253704.1 FAD:protein FMN transferase [Crossiella sp. S99.1]